MKNKIIVLGLIGLIVASLAHAEHELKRSDAYIRHRVLLLFSATEACTGVEIVAPSGKHYTISAAHCKDLVINNKVQAKDEDGKVHQIDFIGLDPEHDLMLLGPADDKAIPVAKDDHAHEKIHTITHGMALPSYRTDGELLEEKTVTVNGEPIESPEELEKCPITPYSRPAAGIFGLYCELKLTLMLSTAMVMPGSSGGPALNKDGELIGIVSISDGDKLSGLVPLRDIQAMLKDK